MFEGLESRRLFALTVVGDGPLLTITGTAASETAEIWVTPDDGDTDDRPEIEVNGIDYSFVNNVAIEGILANMGGGVDTVVLHTAISDGSVDVVINGEEGNDDLTLFAEPGSTEFTLTGGVDNDTFHLSRGGGIVEGGSDDDTYYYSSDANGYSMDMTDFQGSNTIIIGGVDRTSAIGGNHLTGSVGRNSNGDYFWDGADGLQVF
ncbi:MAG: hypothetical protein WBD40_25540 [Tepidisphaeraceae bacterium]